ncbi:UNVERIFIED_CONTAM: hypothetical protein GTU68_037619 [Idotea baltica]|nr:hypothetical protein [Idotea baltica]
MKMKGTHWQLLHLIG